MEATTIHSALRIKASEDDDPDDLEIACGRRRRCGVLIIEEASMIPVPLFAAILRNFDCSHIVVLGDQKQLQLIGPGAPFQNAIASKSVPVTWLTKNYRTGQQGLRDLIEAIDDEDLYDNEVIEDSFKKFKKRAAVFHTSNARL
jgi:ATP-dependent exoDNAse (exonuclease V) alpha subunit